MKANITSILAWVSLIAALFIAGIGVLIQVNTVHHGLCQAKPLYVLCIPCVISSLFGFILRKREQQAAHSLPVVSLATNSEEQYL